MEIERLGRLGDLKSLIRVVPNLTHELEKVCEVLRVERLRY
jgi:hypothetical protein